MRSHNFYIIYIVFMAAHHLCGNSYFISFKNNLFGRNWPNFVAATDDDAIIHFKNMEQIPKIDKVN